MEGVQDAGQTSPETAATNVTNVAANNTASEPSADEPKAEDSETAPPPAKKRRSSGRRTRDSDLMAEARAAYGDIDASEGRRLRKRPEPKETPPPAKTTRKSTTPRGRKKKVVEEAAAEDEVKADDEEDGDQSMADDSSTTEDKKPEETKKVVAATNSADSSPAKPAPAAETKASTPKKDPAPEAKPSTPKKEEPKPAVTTQSHTSTACTSAPAVTTSAALPAMSAVASFAKSVVPSALIGAGDAVKVDAPAKPPVAVATEMKSTTALPPAGDSAVNISTSVVSTAGSCAN